jgi:hypothetical protein
VTDEASLIFSGVISFASFLFGFILSRLWNAVRDLQTADKELIKSVGSMNVVIAGQYVPRQELNGTLEGIFKKLGRIERLVYSMGPHRREGDAFEE